MYKEELLSKPALLVVNKMDLPDAEDKLAELKEQLESPHGKFKGFLFFILTIFSFVLQNCVILMEYKGDINRDSCKSSQTLILTLTNFEVNCPITTESKCKTPPVIT